MSSGPLRERITSESLQEATGRGWTSGWKRSTGPALGVQRTVAAAPTDVWQVITSRPELWLGEAAALSLTPGERYEVAAGEHAPAASGHIRVVKPGDRLRLTWQPAGWSAPATLQLTLSEPGPGRTALGAHLEKLPDAAAREAMRTHWALERIAAAAC